MSDRMLRFLVHAAAPMAAVLLLGVAGRLPAAGSEKPSAAEIEHFEKRIRPLLHEHCYACHSGEADVLQGGLRVDGGAHLLSGGDSGAAVVPGEPDESLLIQSVRYQGDGYDMPPEGKLPDEAIALLVDWVQRGAVFPGQDAAAPAPRATIDWDEGRRFWAFQPLARPSLPPAADALDPDAPQRIDRFIRAKLSEQQLTPAPPADRTTLIRRLSLNLTGLPPTPEEVDDFLTDSSPDAYERLVQRLLASPHYGERWARMWLDLARYADTTESWLGSTPSSHLYRDWVVRALNEDLPYDRFVRLQLAADRVAGASLEDLPALGFLGLSPTYFKELLLPPEIIKVLVADEWEERVDAVSRTFLGLTVACARCHDHKFDPVSTEDYYALAGVFASTRQIDRPMLDVEQYAPVAAAKAEVAKLEVEATRLGKQKPRPSEQIDAVRQQIADIKASTPLYDTPLANVVIDASIDVVLAGDDPQSGSRLEYHPEPQDLHVAIRGNPNRLGQPVPRRFLTVLSDGPPRPLQTGSGRVDLAEAIFDEAAPLAARVIVNRIWLGHFGRGLVETPSNFGRLGDAPSHPELLEDLAAGFVESGWSLKWLHRQIIGSATYRQSSAYNEANAAIDPDNQWLWRMNRRRLEVEPWRDAMLAVAGNLDLTLGGPALAADSPDNLRRTLYTSVHRRHVATMLQLHDFPEPSLHSEQRSTTTTALQGLFVLNSPFMSAQAQALAERLLRDPAAEPAQRVQRAYRLLYSRLPSAAELDLALRYLGEVQASSEEPSSTAAASAAWRQYAHALLGSNELLFVD